MQEKNRLFQGDNGAKPRENQLVGLRSLLNLVGINKDYSRTHSMPFKSFFARYFGGFQFSIGDGGLGVYPDTNWGRLAKEVEIGDSNARKQMAEILRSRLKCHTCQSKLTTNHEPKNRRLRWRCAGCKSSYTIDNVVDCALRPFLALISKDQGRERHGLPAIDHLFNPLSAESARVFRTRYIPHNVSLVHVNPSQGERYAETDAESDANPGPGPDTYWKVTRNNIRIRDYSISRPIIDIEPSPGIGFSNSAIRVGHGLSSRDGSSIR
ncbi:hypothetical protein BC829DRAFT_413547 [Chytridium lagenaria]|nr:hypothetical protein BC829DRAFT_413547 [Chytridium lagenaria]